MSTSMSDEDPRQPAEKIRGYLANLLRNLYVGIKASLCGTIRYEQLAVSWSQLVGLLFLAALLPLAIQRYQVGANGEFSASGLTGAWFVLPLAVITAALCAKSSRREELTLGLIIALLSCSLFVELFVFVIPFPLKIIAFKRWLRWYTVYANTIKSFWLTTAIGIALIRLLRLPRKRRLIVSVSIIVFIYLPLNYIWLDDTLWSEPYDTEASKERLSTYRAAVEEDILYLQPKLLDEKLNAILPGKLDEPTLYFVGVAGDSEQNVFMKEINSVDKLFAERFGTSTHAITLINNRDTLKTTPLASITSLRSALQRIGSVMNKDNDILFMYFTSHGSKEHEFSIEFPPLELRDLNPPTLRQMLDDAGIKWRVVVIAACYSGGFIDPIKNDDTLIITAAAADRTSFGCSNENDYTYFGRAYFVDGLSATDSFIKAFAIAKEVVTKRERKDGFEPSNPQIAVGKNIEAQLQRIADHQKAAQLQ